MSKKHKRHHHHQAHQSLPQATLDPRQAGRRAFNAGRYAEAIAAWSALDSTDPAVAAALAEAHFRQASALGLSDQSLQHLSAAAQLMPQDAVYAYWHGVVLHKCGQLPQALAAYQAAQAHGLARPQAALSLALVERQLGHSTESTELPMPPNTGADFRQPTPHTVLDAVRLLTTRDPAGTAEALQRLSQMSPKLLPRDVGALRYIYLGLAQARTGSLEAARENWRLAARVMPNHPLVKHNLRAMYSGRIHRLVSEGKYTEAAIEADNLRPLLLGDEATHAMAAHVHYCAAEAELSSRNWRQLAIHLRQTADALKHFQKPAARRAVLHNLALALEAQEVWDAASDEWRELLRTHPRRNQKKDPADGYTPEHWNWIRLHTIECYKRAGQLGDAVTVLRQAVKADPSDEETHLDLVRALHANQQLNAAQNEAHRLIEVHPQNTDAIIQLAEMEAADGKYYAAEMTMQRAVEIAPDDPKVRAAMSRVLQARGNDANNRHNYDTARQVFEQALQFAPEDYKSWIGLCRVEFNVGRDDRARECLERGLQTGKGKSDAYLNAFNIWMVEGELDEMKGVIARAEADGALSAPLLGLCGSMIFEQVYPDSAMDSLSMRLRMRLGFGLPSMERDARPKQPTQPALRDYGHALFERAIQIGPAPDALKNAVVSLMGPCPHEAIGYAERLAQVAPDDPNSWLMLGAIHGAQKRIREAKEAFDQAIRLARKTNQAELADLGRGFKQMVEEPNFAMMLRTMFGSAQHLEDELDFLEDLEDIL